MKIQWMFSCLAAVVFVGCASLSAGPKTREIDHGFEVIRNGYTSDEGVRIYGRVFLPDENGRIVIEAEDAPVLAFQGKDVLPEGHGAEPQRARDASGGTYIDWVQYAEYHFRARRAEKYYVWYRFAVPGNNFHHYESLNEQHRRTVRDWTGKGGLEWCWMRAERTWQVGEGVNVFRLHGYMMGARLDKMILTPDMDFEPTGTGPDKSAVERISEAVFETNDFPFFDLVTFVKIDVSGRTEGGIIRKEFSLDRGKTWQMFTDPASIPIVDARSGGVRFRIGVAREADADPVFHGVRVEYVSDPERTVVLADKEYAMLFNRQTGELLTIDNRLTGTRLKHAALPHFPFDLYLFDGRAIENADGSAEMSGSLTADQTDEQEGMLEKAVAGKLRRVKPSEIVPSGAVAKTGGGLEFRYRVLDGKIGVTMTVVPAGDGKVDWNLEIENNSDCYVARTRFPILRNARIGDLGSDDELMYPFRDGRLVKNPNIGASVWERKGPGSASMAWMNLSDDAGGGLYVGNRDLKHRNFLPECPGESGGAIGMSFVLCHAIRPGDTAVWPATVAVHSGGWHKGADIYRAWFGRHHRKYSVPSWLEDAEGMLSFHCQLHPDRQFERMGETIFDARRAGMRHCQIWGQQTLYGGHCGYVIPMPSPEYGSEADFVAAVEKIHANGGTVGVYTRGEVASRFDVYSDYFYGVIPKSKYPPDMRWLSEEEYKRVKLLQLGQRLEWPPDMKKFDAEHKRFTETPFDKRRGNPPFRVYEAVCTWMPEWQDYVGHWIARMIADWRLDAVYWDVMATRQPAECYDVAKGHFGEGRYAEGCIDILKRTEKIAGENKREFLQIVEYFGDVYGQFGVHLGMPCRVFRYTLPDQPVWDWYTRNSRRPDDPYVPGWQAFVQGLYLNDNYRGAGETEVRDLVNLRHRLKGWGWRSRYMDNVGLAVSDLRVRAGWFLRDDSDARGATICYVSDREREGVTATLDVSGLGRIEQALFTDRAYNFSTLEFRRHGTAVTLTLPSSRCGAVVLVSQSSGAKMVTSSARIVAVSGNLVFSLQLINYSKTRRDVAGRFVVTGPFEKPADFRKTLAPYSAETIDFPLGSKPKLEKQALIEVELDVDGCKTLRWDVVDP